LTLDLYTYSISFHILYTKYDSLSGIDLFPDGSKIAPAVLRLALL
ncbi:unnamed protein product, partial [marine sediment metagenome]